MVMMRAELDKYIASIDKVVGLSINNIPDIELDGFNEDGCNGYVFLEIMEYLIKAESIDLSRNSLMRAKAYHI